MSTLQARQLTVAAAPTELQDLLLSWSCYSQETTDHCNPADQWRNASEQKWGDSFETGCQRSHLYPSADSTPHSIWQYIKNTSLTVYYCMAARQLDWQLNFNQKRHHPHFYFFYCYDLDPETLLSNLDLDITTVYQSAKHEFCRSRHSRLIAQTVHIDMLFLPVWPWHWPNDLDVWTQRFSYEDKPSLSSSGILKVIIWQTDNIKIIHHAITWVVKQSYTLKMQRSLTQIEYANFTKCFMGFKNSFKIIIF